MIFFRVVAELPATSISLKYREMWISSNEIVSFYNFSDNGKEQTCIRMSDGNVIITESSVLNDLKKALLANGIKQISLGG